MTWWQVVLWWEIRRLFYNAILFVTGLASVLAMEWFFDRFLPAGEDGVEPMTLFFAAVGYGIVANVCYTLGWIVELIGRRVNADRSRVRAKREFLVGLWVSSFLTTAPLWFGLLSWLIGRKA